MSVQLVE